MVAVLESGIIVELHGPWWSLWCMVAKVEMIDVALILMWMVFVEVDAVVVVFVVGFALVDAKDGADDDGCGANDADVDVMDGGRMFVEYDALVNS